MSRFEKFRNCLAFPLICWSSLLWAGTSPTTKKASSIVYAGGYGGYGLASGMHGSDGQFVQGRFALGVDAYKWPHVVLGVEAAVQSGNTMRLDVSSTTLNEIGGLFPQVALKPFADLLAVARFKLPQCVFLFAKGGVAYRRFQFEDRDSFQDAIRRFNGEVQGGIGYKISPHARIVGFYQIIFSGNNAGVRIAPNDDLLLGRIPTQQGGMIGLEYAL